MYSATYRYFRTNDGNRIQVIAEDFDKQEQGTITSYGTGQSVPVTAIEQCYPQKETRFSKRLSEGIYFI
ncbi:hypothetical protein [Pontibacter silvestris]|uniref:hypothetical protein n=1 Tax=Pontibacter silvestris TaxID=2305183 RepID=UPI0036726868